MKMNWKALFLFLCFCAVSTYIAYTIEDNRKREELAQQERERIIEKIKESGICYEAVRVAADKFPYGTVKKILDMPKIMRETNGPYTLCSVNIVAGDIWIPDRTWKMTYLVLSNNGFYQVMGAVATAAE